jgi:transcriptional regulator with XRE-family HTH domain
MKKSLFTDEYTAVTELLVETRKGASYTQVELAEALNCTQSFVSKVERGENRLDVIQLRTILSTLGSTLPAFVDELEQRLPERKTQR